MSVESPPEGSTDHYLGFIAGQLKELIHTSANNGAKLDSLGLRIQALETDKNRRDGMGEIFRIILKSPTLAWIVAGVVFFYAKITNKI